MTLKLKAVKGIGKIVFARNFRALISTLFMNARLHELSHSKLNMFCVNFKWITFWKPNLVSFLIYKLSLTQCSVGYGQ
jgi:hypothetical protein